MREYKASRTLVKSPPELWAECSDPSSLTRHLRGSFGEIKITRLEPETAVAWEGERVSGTVRLEPSGWGTRVVLTARAAGSAAGKVPGPIAPGAVAAAGAGEAPVAGEAAGAGEAPVAREASAAPPAPPRRAAPPRRGFTARLRGWLSGQRPTAVAAGQAAAFEPPRETAWESSPETAWEPAPEAAREPAGETAWEPASEPESENAAESVSGAAEILTAALDSLGQAHHRPYSRA